MDKEYEGEELRSIRLRCGDCGDSIPRGEAFFIAVVTGIVVNGYGEGPRYELHGACYHTTLPEKEYVILASVACIETWAERCVNDPAERKRLMDKAHELMMGPACAHEHKEEKPQTIQ
jgi:hypothetical protein